MSRDGRSPRPAGRPPFAQLQFGYKSAEAERREKPSLLDKGFFDKDRVSRQIVSGSKYLILGYKGSGKSAVAEHLSVLSESDPLLFVSRAQLGDFPFDQVPEVVSSKGDVEIRTNLGWSLILLLRLLQSLELDNGIAHSEDIRRLLGDLRTLGLLPKRRLRDLVLASRDMDLTVTLPRLLKASVRQGYKEPVLVLSQARDAIRDMLSQLESPSKHLLVIDGLDDLFADFSDAYSSITSLVHEVDALNAEFQDRRGMLKIVLLCRTDLYERLHSPNINKLRDFSVILDWHRTTQSPAESDLFKLINQRAAMSGYRGNDVFESYLPRRAFVDHPSYSGNSFLYLLQFTRHTPRDLNQLLRSIQERGSGNKVGPAELTDGTREYSNHYFLPEIRDELAGYVNSDEIAATFGLIAAHGTRRFALDDLPLGSTKNRLDPETLRVCLEAMFNCSALGNMSPAEGGRSPHYTFRFRNRHSSINFGLPFVVHRGAWRALNLH